MPQIIDAHASAKNPIIIEAVIGALQTYAATVLNEQPIVFPNPGYEAYNKRVAFAALAVHNPQAYAEQAAVYIEQVTNGLIAESQNNSVQPYNYIIEQNPSGKSLFEADANQRATVSSVGRTSGNSIFDVLAGVNQSDLV
jgi:hypothetical protein